MQNGIYHVQFRSGQGHPGEGLVVIKDGTVNGGDPSHLYIGKLLIDGVQLTCHLDIKQWNRNAPSVFGSNGDFSLSLTGTTQSGGFFVSGGIVNQPGLQISITARRLSDAA